MQRQHILLFLTSTAKLVITAYYHYLKQIYFITIVDIAQ